MWKYTITFFTLFALLLSITQCILIPLSANVPRCMIVYSVGQAQTVKVDINFPVLPGNHNDQFYQVSWRNTQNDQFKSQLLQNGRFKRQLALTQNVIYDLCLVAKTAQDFGAVHVQYSANNLFAVNQAQVKVPANLLKSTDITNSYLSAQSIQKNLNAFIKIQNDKAQTHADIFRQTNLISQRLVQISIAELVVIVVAGCYQFWMLWKYLKSKHYI